MQSVCPSEFNGSPTHRAESGALTDQMKMITDQSEPLFLLYGLDPL